MALTGWLLIVENGDVSAFSQTSSSHNGIPQTQALVSAPVDFDVQSLSVGELVRQSVTEDAWVYFSVKVPAHANGLNILVSPDEGDVDLYVREGHLPVGDIAHGGRFDASSSVDGSLVERVSLSKANNKTWFIGVHGYHASRFELSTEIN